MSLTPEVMLRILLMEMLKKIKNVHQDMKISVTSSTEVKILNTIQYIIHFVCQIDMLALNDIEF